MIVFPNQTLLIVRGYETIVAGMAKMPSAAAVEHRL